VHRGDQYKWDDDQAVRTAREEAMSGGIEACQKGPNDVTTLSEFARVVQEEKLVLDTRR